MGTVVICGAGVDKSDGIDMPLAAELVPKIRAYLKTTEGENVDQVLRAFLPNLRFSYDKFIKEAVEKLSNEFRGQVASIVDNIQEQVRTSVLNGSDQKLGELIVALLTKIQRLQDDVRLDDATEALIAEVFGGDITVDDENIIDLPKLSFTDVFNVVMRRIFERSLDEPDHPVLKHIRGKLMDFEQLLMESFIGFYTNSESQMKRYMYLSWTLWAYLKHTETAAIQRFEPTPFYAALPEDWQLITLNYTSFARMRFGSRALYFHGDLSSFVRMHDRQLVSIDGYHALDIADFLKNVVGANTEFGKNIRPRCVVPSIVPPLKLKPVLSNAYIDVWYRSKEAIAKADRIVVVGYSFNYADEHFNDLIRQHKDKQIVVVDPYAENVRDNLRNIFSYAEADYVSNTFKGQACFQKDKLRIIAAKAADVTWTDL